MPLFGPPNIAKMKSRYDMKGLIKALDYEKDVQVQIQAARALGDLDYHGGIQAILPLIDSPNDALAKATIDVLTDHLNRFPGAESAGPAIEALARSNRTYAWDALALALTNHSFNIRSAAAKALGQSGNTRAVELLIPALKDKEPMVVVAAALALGRTADPRALLALIDALGKSSRLDEQRALLEAIGQFKDTRAVAVLLRYFRTEGIHYETLLAAARGLAYNDWQPGKQAEKYKFWIALEDWDRLVAEGRPAAGVLVAYAVNSPDEKRGAAISRMGAPAFEAVEKHLKGRDVSKRRWAAHLLRYVGGRRSVDLLIERLQDRDPYIRDAAADSLAQLFSSPTIDSQSKQLILRQRDVVIWESYRGDAGIGDELARKDYPARTLGSYLKIVE